MAAPARLGRPCRAEQPAPRARPVDEPTAHDPDPIEGPRASPTERVEAAVELTVLYEPVVPSLRRLADAEKSARRHQRQTAGVAHSDTP